MCVRFLISKSGGKMFSFINEKRKNLLRKEILSDLKKLKIKKVLDDGCGMNGSWD